MGACTIVDGCSMGCLRGDHKASVGKSENNIVDENISFPGVTA